ncbi:pilus assembly protein CpaE [Ornithinimicrobium pratense]|uniref:Pilus assembly protein CpaE n=1 Tax=Ornithinimicrobium pratense TaxID=2593973 RepID=A0A5J6V977_9MICO|nr:pilus assembly protein CpaE [Ornithinimicrobium pratense]QFG69562.1 pilus assembly protein CpaE [Ornithinimicrobium pratense]
MISVDLARRLHDEGLVWSPMPGDRFVVDRPGMEQDVFHLADMTVDVHHLVGGSVIGFNGVAEWALDSVALEETLWLPREDQLRAVLGHDFVGLGMEAEGYAVVALVDGAPLTFSHRDAEEAYGLAVLEVLRHRS